MVKFIDPGAVVAAMGLSSGDIVADFGTGAGFYAVAAGRAVGNSGVVYAIDVQEAKLAATQSAAKQAGLKNIMVIKADLEKPFLDLAEASCNAVILASILHEVNSQEPLLKNAYRLLKTGGRILAVEWKRQQTPFGPAMERRLDEAELDRILANMGMRPSHDIPADSYHYAKVFIK